ncbi:cell surface protein [Pulveribacter suum]|nr:cell surface protein [Pulveribacter suum]
MALSIAAMIGGLGFAGAASAAVITGTTGATNAAASIQAGEMAKATATSLTLAEGGVGNALIVPYFTTQNGNMSVFHVTNTDTDNGKVVKVRFRSAANSDDILDFQLFLSPGDVWTAAVLADENGLSQLVTSDNTCTVPHIPKNTFIPFRKGNLPAFAADQNQLTREGYVEIFNIADITNVKTWDAAGAVSATGTQFSPLYKATKHVNGVAPCSAAGEARTLLDDLAVTNFTEPTAVAAGLQTPSGGLMGDWYIQNIAQSTTFAGVTTTITANGRANFTHFPQVAQPATATANDVTADALFRTTFVRDAVGAPVTTAAKTLLDEDVPDLSTPMLPANAVAEGARAQASDLLAALAVTSVTNQYALNAPVQGKTDWVFSMPARRYNVVANYGAVSGASGASGPTAANAKYRLFTDLSAAATQDDNWFYTAVNAAAAPAGYGAGGTGQKAAGNTTVDAATGNICVYADGQKFWDREETTGTTGPTFSPGSTTKASFCGEVSVLAFNDTGKSVLGAEVARSNTTLGYVSGWGRLDTTNADMGLPLTGASFIKLTNPSAAAGMMGTYGITWPHRFTK